MNNAAAADDRYKALVIFLLVWCVVISGVIIHDHLVSHQPTQTIKQPVVVEALTASTLVDEAARLKKQFDSVHIYAVSNGFEVWCTEGIFPGLWKTTNSLTAARAVVDEYYIEWANNILGKPRVAGRLVE